MKQESKSRFVNEALTQNPLMIVLFSRNTRIDEAYDKIHDVRDTLKISRRPCTTDRSRKLHDHEGEIWFTLFFRRSVVSKSIFLSLRRSYETETHAFIADNIDKNGLKYDRRSPW